MPLAIKGGSHSSNSSKYVNTNSSHEDTVKIATSRANDGMVMNNHTDQKEVIKDLELNSYKEAILKEPNRNKDHKYLWKNGLF